MIARFTEGATRRAGTRLREVGGKKCDGGGVETRARAWG